jgi:hypothetical protein
LLLAARLFSIGPRQAGDAVSAVDRWPAGPARRPVRACPVVDDNSLSGAALAGPNTIELAGRTYLLVEGASADHLVAGTDDGTKARPAVDTAVFGAELAVAAYDLVQLGEKRWAARALCGYEWGVMAAGEAGPLLSHQQEVSVANCRTCLRLITRSFARAEPDERIEVLVRLVAEQVAERGYAEVVGTPGEQYEALRSAIRAGIHRLGQRVRTFVLGERLCIVSQDGWERLSEEERLTRLREAMNVTFSDEEPASAGEPSWRFTWRDWEHWSR